MNHAPILFLLACCALFAACHKEKLPTTIKGKVTNSVTGEPVADAVINCQISNTDKVGVPARDNSTQTDLEGNYILTIPPGYGWNIIEVYKPGFLPNVFPGMGQTFEFGVEDTLDIELIPEDGFIRLILINDLPGTDSVYVKFLSPTRQAQPHIGGQVTPKKNPNIIPKNGLQEEIIAFPAEEYIKIYWDTKIFAPAITGTFSDSIYVTRYDTVDYTIHF